MTSYVLNIIAQGQDRASGPLGAVQNILGKIGAVSFAGLATAGAALGAFTASAIAAGTDFEQKMSGVQAILNGTADDLARLKALALNLGLDPALTVSASEAANMIEILGRNGLTTTQILGGAARSTVLLANATGADFGTAADIATSAMSVFKIRAEDMGKALNGIVGVTNASKFTINDYAMALAQGGGVAAAVGVQYKDFNTAIAAISPLFGSGSDAGTSFKTFLTRLVPSSDEAAATMRRLGLNFFDANGQMLPMADIAGELEEGLRGLSDQQRNAALQTLFGADAFRAAAALADTGRAGYLELAGALEKVNAEQAAAVRVDNLAGALDILSGSFEGLKLVVGSAPLGFLKDITLQAAQGVSTLATSLDTLFKAANASGDPLAYIGQQVWNLFPPEAQNNLALLGQWLGVVLPAAGQAAADIWSGVILPALANAQNFIQTQLLPLLGNVWTILVNGAGEAIPQFVAYWNGVLIPALQGFWEWTQTNILPLLAGLWNWFSVNLPQGLRAASDFFNGVLLPAMLSVSTWVLQTLLPTLESTRAALVEKVGGALTSLSAFWTGTLKPAMETVWSWMSKTLFPFIVAVADFLSAVFEKNVRDLSLVWTGTLQPALKSVYDFFQKNINPVIEEVSKKIETGLRPILKGLSEFINSTVLYALGEFARGFEGISSALRGVTEWLGRVADAIRALPPPPPLWTPGSPTPFENGLRGISAAAGDLARQQLPSLAAAVGALPTGSPLGALTAAGPAGAWPLGGVGNGGGGVTINNTYNLSANYAFQSERALRDDVRMLQMLTSEA